MFIYEDWNCDRCGKEGSIVTHEDTLESWFGCTRCGLSIRWGSSPDLPIEVNDDASGVVCITNLVTGTREFFPVLQPITHNVVRKFKQMARRMGYLQGEYYLTRWEPAKSEVKCLIGSLELGDDSSLDQSKHLSMPYKINLKTYISDFDSFLKSLNPDFKGILASELE